MDNRTRYIPAIVMLSAGFLVCVTTILHGFTTKEIILLSTAVMVVFLFVGFIVKFIIDKYVVATLVEESEEETEEKGEETEEEDVEVKEKE